MSAHLVMLPYGKLPVLSYFAIHSGLGLTEARNALDAMRAVMRKEGPSNLVLASLRLCGFDWHPAPSIDEDVAAVADALQEGAP